MLAILEALLYNRDVPGWPMLSHVTVNTSLGETASWGGESVKVWNCGEAYVLAMLEVMLDTRDVSHWAMLSHSITPTHPPTPLTIHQTCMRRYKPSGSDQNSRGHPAHSCLPNVSEFVDAMAC
jgi:hypothetical protein